MEYITIFTPTYNREKLLPRLYNSLVEQENNNFIWLVVDDGSNDNTKELITSFIKENKIKIEYIYQSNAGKNQAYNTGILNCRTRWFMCLDSDDYLTCNSINLMLNQIHYIRGTKYIGVLSPKGCDSVTTLKQVVFPNLKFGTITDIYKAGFIGEINVLLKADIAKLYLFPKIENEKFVTEAYILDQIDAKYEYYINSEIIVIAEYQEDGLTNNILKLYKNNPKSYSAYFNQKMKLSNAIMDKIKAGAQYICYSLFAGKKNFVSQSTSIPFVLMAFPLGIYLYLKRLYQYRHL